MFKLEIETENAIYSETPISEITRILQEAVTYLESVFDDDAEDIEGGKILRDVNGNKTGFLSISIDNTY